MMRRPGAITASIVAVSVTIFFVILTLFLETAGPIEPTELGSELAIPAITGVLILAPLVLDLVFLLLRKYWAHILNLVIVGALIALFSVAAVLVAKRPDIYLGAVCIATIVGLLVCLFIACFQVPRNTDYFIRKKKWSKGEKQLH